MDDALLAQLGVKAQEAERVEQSVIGQVTVSSCCSGPCKQTDKGADTFLLLLLKALADKTDERLVKAAGRIVSRSQAKHSPTLSMPGAYSSMQMI